MKKQSDKPKSRETLKPRCQLETVEDESAPSSPVEPGAAVLLRS